MASGTRTATQRDRALRSYVRRELYPHVEAARERLNAARLGPDGIRSVADLSRVEPVALDEVGDGSRHVLRPSRADLLRSGTPFMRARTAWASTWGRWGAFMRRLEPAYRPVHFFAADGVPVGAATGDLIRLAGLGAAWLAETGVSRADTVALVGGAGAGIEAWELSGGTRRGGIPLVVVEGADSAARHAATVVAGRADDVVAALGGGAWPALRLAIVFGANAGTVEKRLVLLRADGQVAVRRAWAPAGTRSVWFECVGGPTCGWHTVDSADVVELDPDGEVLWTGLGWAGTVFLRLRTGVIADRLDDAVCAACAHRGVRVFARPGNAALGRWLRADSRVADLVLHEHGADVLPHRAGAHARLTAEAKKLFPHHRVAVKTKKTWAK